MGMAASSFAVASADPPVVLFCAARSSVTWPQLRRSPRLGLSILAEDQAELCRQLAGPSPGRFGSVEWAEGPGGAVLLAGAAAWLECRVTREVEAGDHWLVILDVAEGRPGRVDKPLIFYGSHFERLAEATPARGMGTQSSGGTSHLVASRLRPGPGPRR
jgi:flavin reductase (DIM6/NTAB) family NADH-FMN oxidoreductase RutF